MRRTHIMVDLETADTKPTAAIFSIGAVAFTAAGVTQKFHAVVDLQSSTVVSVEVQKQGEKQAFLLAN